MEESIGIQRDKVNFRHTKYTQGSTMVNLLSHKCRKSTPVLKDINLAILNVAFTNGSVVECLTRDRGAAGASLTSVTALCP